MLIGIGKQVKRNAPATYTELFRINVLDYMQTPYPIEQGSYLAMDRMQFTPTILNFAVPVTSFANDLSPIYSNLLLTNLPNVAKVQVVGKVFAFDEGIYPPVESPTVDWEFLVTGISAPIPGVLNPNTQYEQTWNDYQLTHTNGPGLNRTYDINYGSAFYDTEIIFYSLD